MAEPVDVTEDHGPSDARRVVVNAEEHMDSIEETSSDAGEDAPLIADHGENGVKSETVEAEVGGAIERDDQGQERLAVAPPAKSGNKKKKGKKAKKDLLG